MENKHLLSGVGPGLDLKEGGMITREVIESDKIIRSSFAYLEYFRGGWSWGFFGFLTATVLAGLFGITTKRA